MNYSTEEKQFKRFWKLVEVAKGDECWQWLGQINTKNKYAYFTYYGIPVRAARFIWKRLNYRDDLSRKLHICHSCDNKGCVNPKHLFLGTHQENMDDKVNKDRQHRPKGTLHPGAKLTENDVLEIKRLYKTGKYTYKQIGESFNIEHTAIYRIMHGKSWKHVKENT